MQVAPARKESATCALPGRLIQHLVNDFHRIGCISNLATQVSLRLATYVPGEAVIKLEPGEPMIVIPEGKDLAMT